LAGSLMLKTPPVPNDLGRPLPGPGSIRWFFAQDPQFRGRFDMNAYRGRVMQLSRMFDPTDPDLAPFAAHGKLIIIDYGADYLKSPYGSRNYFEAVRRRVGGAAEGEFLRYYVIPGLGHGGRGKDLQGQPLPNRIDIMTLLENWVERGQAPGNETLRSFDERGHVVAQRPLCRYPTLPIYSQVSGFACRDNHDNSGN
jgi:feruloyl esterase